METWIARGFEALLCAPVVGGPYRHGFDSICSSTSNLCLLQGPKGGRMIFSLYYYYCLGVCAF